MKCFSLILVVILVWSISLRSSTVLAEVVSCQTYQNGSSCEESQGCFHDQNCFTSETRYKNDNYRHLKTVDVCSSTRRCSMANSNATLIQLKSVDAQLVSVDPKYFSVNVRWTLKNNSGHYGGYELRLLKDENIEPYRCLCISDSNLLSFSMINIEYATDYKNMKVEVLPYPSEHHNEPVRTFFTKPEGCADIEHENTLCDIKSYSRPENLTVLSSVCSGGMKELDISWDPPSLPPNGTKPPTYYIYVYRDHSKTAYKTFIVHHTRRVRVNNLNASCPYRVKVRPYKRCSGLGNYHINQDIGCGNSIEESEMVTSLCNDTKGNASTVTENTVYNITEGPDNISQTRTQHILVYTLISTFVALAIILVLFAVLILYLRSCYDTSKDVHPTSDDSKESVVVFYCRNTPSEGIDYIQKHVIFPLTEYFQVISLNDFSKGDIVKWLERVIRTSRAVLIVGNKEFCVEWMDKVGSRSPLLNSLDHIISAEVSSDTIERFGIILLDDSQKEHCIPDNSYLNLMPIFVMGKGKSDTAKIYRFVTHTKQIEFRDSTLQSTSDSACIV